MLSTTPFVSTAAPSTSLELDTDMPCYEFPTMCHSGTCQGCSIFPSGKSMATPSLPASDFAISFDKISCFNWSEMGIYAEDVSACHEDTCSCLLDTKSEVYFNEPKSNCPVCSMVPYGAICSSCNQIQTSRATVLATPPAAAWPMVDRLGDWEGTKTSEEDLLKNLDMELFDQINVPHEVDEWGRRVYNDCGHRIIYCVDEDGNTVMGYEAWYPSSVTGDYEEPAEWCAGRQAEDSADEMEIEDPEHEIVIDGSETWFSCSATQYQDSMEWCTRVQDEDISMVDFEQQRFAEFLAAQDEEIPEFQMDRERIAKWIASSSVDDDGDFIVLDSE